MKKFDWSKITYEDVLEAINIFIREKPEHPEAISTFLVYHEQRLPAKHIRGMAYKVAFGEDISKNDYSGGMETIRFFEKLGFQTEYLGKLARREKRLLNEKKKTSEGKSKAIASKRKKSNFGENKTVISRKKRFLGENVIRIPVKNEIKQKNALQLLLNKIYKGDLVCEKTFPWLRTPVDIEGDYKKICDELTNYRGDSTFIKKNTPLKCDFVCDGEKTIIEYDERQHFSEARRRSLLSYRDIKLDYDRDLWIKACEDVQAKDGSPFNRDEKRAYFDSVRDIEASKNGYKLIRLMHGQIDYESADAESKLRKILGMDNANTTGEANMKGQEKNGLKIGLYLQTKDFKNEYDFNKAINIVKNSEIDIFVLPEFAYFPFVSMVKASDISRPEDMEKIYKKSLELSKEIGRAVIISSVDRLGAIFSVFANAFSEEKETRTALHIKHTMTGKSAFDFNGYEVLYKSIFEPILYKGRKIGMTICYDCNHSLFSRVYGLQKVDIIINSTGGDVDYSKWHRYNKVRAIENSCYNFITMGAEKKEPKAFAYGFNPNGKELTAINGERSNKNNCPGKIYVYDTALDDGGASRDLNIDQDESENKRRHLEFPLGRSREILKNARKLTDGVYVQEKGDLNIVYIVVEGDDILKPEKVLSLMYSDKLKELKKKRRYIIINRHETIDEEFFENKLSVILKVRALENFCAVILESGNINRCYQASCNRKSQIVKETNGIYVLDLIRTSGPEAIWKNKNQMKASWRKNFEWLINKISQRS